MNDPLSLRVCNLLILPHNPLTLSTHSQSLTPFPGIRKISLTGIESQIGSTNIYPDRRLSFPSASAGSISSVQISAEQKLYSTRPDASCVEFEAPKINSHLNQRQLDSQSLTGSPGSSKASSFLMESSNSGKWHYMSNFEGGINRQSFASKGGAGSVEHPSSTLSIDPNRGPPDFQPRTMEHPEQPNSFTTAYSNGMMPNTELFGSHTAHNGSINHPGPMVQDPQPGGSIGLYNHFVNPNGTVLPFNQAFPSIDTFNPPMAPGGTVPQAPAAYQPIAQYAAGYQGGLVASTTHYNGSSAGYTAPGNPGDPMTQFKQPYHQNALYGPSEKPNALLEEVNRALSTFHPFSPIVNQNAPIAQVDQFYRPPASNTQVGQGCASMISVNQGYGLPSIYGSKGGAMSQASQVNRFNAPPSTTYVGDGSQASSIRSDPATVGQSESLRNSPKTMTKPMEMHMPQAQSPNRSLVLKDYFGPTNPFGPITPPSGPIKLPPEQPKKPSWHLHYIAPNGARPHVDMALDSFNLPFVEMCRSAQVWNKGVLRIINVSVSTSD
jgi:hypothetical protein